MLSIIEGLQATDEGRVRMPATEQEAADEGGRWSSGAFADDERYAVFRNVIGAGDGTYCP